MWEAIRNAVTNGLKMFWDYLVLWAASFNVDFFNSWQNSIAGIVAPSMEVYVTFKPFINAWVPIDFGGILLAAWLMHTLAFSVTKFLLKLLPTIG